jgi:hypothetical protein
MIAIRFANPIICPQMRQSWSGNDTSQPYPCNRRLDCACDQARRAGVAPVSIFIIIGRYGSSYCHWHTKAHAEISRTLRFRAKHQPPSRRVVGRTGAVQDAARISGIIVSRRSVLESAPSSAALSGGRSGWNGGCSPCGRKAVLKSPQSRRSASSGA